MGEQSTFRNFCAFFNDYINSAFISLPLICLTNNFFYNTSCFSV